MASLDTSLITGYCKSNLDALLAPLGDSDVALRGLKGPSMMHSVS